jgi:serine/threonine-protein kinase
VTARPDPRLGTDFGPYRVEAVIGRGGMGVVYRAEQVRLGRKVALKVLAPDYADDEAFRARFLRESKMAAAIDHPNIIPIYEAGEVEGAYFLAMRYVDGTDLETRLRTGPLTPDASVRLLGQVAGALDAAHAAGLVHRDVKPANLLIASGQGQDRDDHLYLTDFGLTKQRGSETGLTRTGSFLGTLEYIAPEQIEGKPLDGRADQYALAAIAVACLSGQPPFPRDSDVAILNAHLRDAPPSLHERRTELPVAADRVIARGLAKKPDERYPDCRAFVTALRDALGVTATQQRARPPRSVGRRRPLLAAAAVAVAVVLTVGWYLLGSGGSGPGATPSLSPSEVAVASPTPNASPTLGAFPNEAETALLKALPDAATATCERGPYGKVGENQGAPPTSPLASLSCPQAIYSGATDFIVRQFKFTGLSAGNHDFTTDAAVSDLAQRYGTRGGDCATEGRVNGRWALGSADAGAIVCYLEPTTGDAFLWWSYEDHAILVEASNPRGDRTALYAFFLSVARFIAP